MPLFPVEFLKQCILCHSLLPWEELRRKRKGEWKGNSITNFLQSQYTLGKFYSHSAVFSLASGEEGSTNWDITRANRDPCLTFWSGALIYWVFFSQLQASSYFIFIPVLKDHCSHFFSLFRWRPCVFLGLGKSGNDTQILVVKPG